MGEEMQRAVDVARKWNGMFTKNGEPHWLYSPASMNDAPAFRRDERRGFYAFLVVLIWVGSFVCHPAFAEDTSCTTLEEISQRTTLEDLSLETGFPCSANAAAQLALESRLFPPPKLSSLLGVEIEVGDAYFLFSRRSLDAMWNTGEVALASEVFQLSFAALLEEPDPDIDKVRLWLLFQNSLIAASGHPPSSDLFRATQSKLAMSLGPPLEEYAREIARQSCLIAAERPGLSLKETMQDQTFHRCIEGSDDRSRY